MSRKYFGTDGIRGRVGQYPINPEFCLRLGWAVGTVFANRGVNQGNAPAHIIIGKDTRISGYMLESVLESGLAAAGADVSLLGPMPTPAIAYLTRTLRADAGIVISASHNPYYDNGIKFFDGQGNKLADEVELEIEAQLEQSMACVDSERLGRASRISDAAGRYIEFCKATVARGFSLRGMRIVLDCANGATYHVAPRVFEELGADVIVLGAEPNGVNINEGCGSTSPETLQEKVIEVRADVGIAFDGDGDRVVMVDAQGNLIDGDEILYIIATYRQSKGTLGGGVVGTVMTNFGIEKAFSAAGIAFLRASVGDRNVTELLHNQGWSLGGEASGHILCLDLLSTGDAIVAALQALVPVVELNKTISELVEGVSKLPQVMINVKVKDPSLVAACEVLKNAVSAKQNVLADRGRVLVRPSGTEPLLRVMVEGEDSDEVRQIANELAVVAQSQN
ncbi:MAG: phosphoglucosamine mutase [Gammaproteobacteria bacterium]|nr:phosphoglucosamine mutase [Gammaproteobacteria bacterium]